MPINPSNKLSIYKPGNTARILTAQDKDYIIADDAQKADKIISYPAGENILSEKCVKVIGGEVYYFDVTEIDNYGLLVGITKTSGSIGENVEIYLMNAGVITVSQTLIVGLNYFAGINGLITEDTSNVLVQKIGTAIDTNKLLLQSLNCFIG